MLIKYYNKKDYQAIAELYGLGKVSSLSYLYRGFGGSAKVAVVTPGGKYVISKNLLSAKTSIGNKSRESLQYEIDMLETVKEMKVPNFLKSVKGKYIEKYGDGWITVYKYLPGTSPQKMSPAMAYELGLFLGEFHKRGQKFKKTLRTRRKYYDLNPRVMKAMDNLAHRQSNKTLMSYVERIRQGVADNQPPAKLPAGPIHVDIYSRNLLYERNKLSAVIDFGNFYIGPFMVDVGKAIMWNCSPNGRLDRNLLRRFLTGYQSQRKFNKQEIAYLKKAILYAVYSHIWVDLYHVTIKYVPEKWPLFLIKSFMPIVEQIEKNNFSLYQIN